VNRAQTLNLLSQHKAGMQHRFALFGSRARDQSCAHSDIDLLVEFDGPATLARYFGLPLFSKTCPAARSIW
jgi:uncharacterized protein